MLLTLYSLQHNFIVFSRVIQAFTTYQNAKGGPAAYFYDLRRALEVSQASCQIVVTFLGDCVAVGVFSSLEERFTHPESVALPRMGGI